jgi:heterodisulfide reductase subunit B
MRTRAITIQQENIVDIAPMLMHSSCNYDISKIIKLANSFDTTMLDNIMKDNKSDVVIYNNKTYIMGLYNDQYALWECVCEKGDFLINQRTELNKSDFVADDWIEKTRPAIAQEFGINEMKVEELYYSFFFNIY